MLVTKRGGATEPLDIAKIHKVTEWACDGLDVSQSELEVEAKLQFFDGIRTSQIHDALIGAAAGLNSIEFQDWTYVAARLVLQKVMKEATNDIFYPCIQEYLNLGVAIGKIDSRLANGLFDLDQIDAAIKPARDMGFTYVGIQTLADRYLIRGEDRKIIELPQHFYMRVAMGLAINESDPTARAIEFYNVLSRRAFHNSTPTLFNAGTTHPQLASCFLNTVADTISNKSGTHKHASIFGTIEECANLSKFSGGIGTDWTRVREANSYIKGTDGISSGPVPYLKIYNDTAVAVNQCFAPDTLVRVPAGVKRIADIKVGDLVLGQRGAYREVREVMAYDQKDAMVALKTKHSLEPLLVTSGHPVFAIRGVSAEQSIERTMKQIDAGKFKQEWVEAEQLQRGDYVAQVVPESVAPYNDFTEEDARMYGIMLGDGHCHKKSRLGYENDKEWGVTGSSADEETLVFVAEYLAKRGLNYHISELGEGRATQIKWSYGGEQLCRNELGHFVKSENCLPFDYDDLYDIEGNKRIASHLTHLPLPQALAMVQGLIDSDGCVSRGKEVTFTNTSIALIEGLRYQMLRLGVPTAGNKKVRSNEHLGYDSVTTSWEVRIPAITELAQALGIPAVTKFNWFRIDNLIFSRVSSVEQIDPTPVVYDLKVEGDETYSTTSALVHNGGKRQGSFAPYMETHHPDLFAFADLKKESGDERQRAHDIYPSNWIPDLFMKRVREGGDWSFFSVSKFPELHELYGAAYEHRYTQLEAAGEAVKTMPAMEVWKRLLGALFETGHPWITFKDACNLRNPQGHCGVIHNSNLCTEITLNTSDDETAVCNIGSVNMAAHVVKMPDGAYALDWNALSGTIKTAVRMLDNTLDIGIYVSERAELSNRRHRPIGLGLMGYTEMLVMLGVDWESQRHLEFADQMMERFSFCAINASCDLAKERGSYQTFPGSKWSRGILPIDTAAPAAEALTVRPREMDWDALAGKIQKYGMRNSNVMAIAPTATISNIVGTTATIEPVFERIVTKKNLSGVFVVTDPSLRYGRKELCKEAYEIDQTWLIKAAAVRQKWIDQSQSLNLFAKRGTKGRDLSAWYMLAWELGLKTTYYLKGQSAKMKEAEPAMTVDTALKIVNGTDVLEDEPVGLCSITNPDCQACE